MDDELLKRFFAGECSEEEHEEVMAWYRAGKADNELSAQIEAYWKAAEAHMTEAWDKEEVFDQLVRRLPKPAQSESLSKPSRKFLTYHTAWHYAATVTLLLTLGALWYVFTEDTTATSRARPNVLIRHETQRGEKAQYLLPDGTKVIMNADSRIQYSEDFENASERVICLEGEAFFDVSKNALRPFIIHSHDITTTVLGTSFNVQAFEGEGVAVSVLTGKVKVEKNLQTVYLHTGEQAVQKISDRNLTKEPFDASLVLAWKEGTIYFKNERFTDIVKTLERWYGVDIDIQKNDIEDGFTGSYHRKSLDAVMEGIGFVLGFEYEIKGNQVVIK